MKKLRMILALFAAGCLTLAGTAPVLATDAGIGPIVGTGPIGHIVQTGPTDRIVPTDPIA